MPIAIINASENPIYLTINDNVLRLSESYLANIVLDVYLDDHFAMNITNENKVIAFNNLMGINLK
jgi:hypothetical protein